jgi:hypothetical protein
VTEFEPTDHAGGVRLSMIFMVAAGLPEQKDVGHGVDDAHDQTPPEDGPLAGQREAAIGVDGARGGVALSDVMASLRTNRLGM